MREKARCHPMKDSVVKYIIHNFRKIGFSVGKYPYHSVVISAVICLFLSLGILKFNFFIRSVDLLASENSKFEQDKVHIEQLFPTNYSTDFEITRAARIDRFGAALITAKDGGSILRTEYFREILKIDAQLRNASVTWKGDTYKYQNICAKTSSGRCFDNDILYLEKHLDTFNAGHYKFRYPLSVDPSTLKVYLYPLFIGGVEVDTNGFVISAKAINLWYILDFAKNEDNDLHIQWEHNFLEILRTFDSEAVDLYRITSESLVEEVTEVVKQLLPFVPIVAFILVVFTIISMSTTDWVESKPWLGICSMTASGLGVGAAIGTGQFAGLTFCPLNIIITFIMLGISLDDCFVILASWKKTDSSLAVEDRLKECYGQAAVPITITSLTNFISFCIGASTSFPLTKLLSFYAALSVLYCYLTTIFFFGGFLAIFGHLEKRGIHSLTLYHTVIPKSSAHDQGKFFYIFCTGGKNLENPSHPLDKDNDSALNIISQLISKYLQKRLFVAVVFVSYAFYWGLCIWGLTNITVESSGHRLLPDYSYASQYFETNSKYFTEYQVRIQVIINQPLHYWEPDIQNKLEHLLRAFENSTYIAGSEMSESWLRYFEDFFALSNTYRWFRGQPLLQKNREDFIFLLKNAFLKLPGYRRFANDIVFSENGSEIVASRFFIQTSEFDMTKNATDLLRDLRDIVSQQDIPVASTYHYFFTFAEHFEYMLEVMLTCVASAICIMIVISYLFIPKFRQVFIIGVTVISVEIGILGLMPLVGLKINTMNMILFIISVGFSVDNTAHVMCAFNESPSSDPGDKIVSALRFIGKPIFQGYSTSMIASVVLFFVQSQVYYNSAILFFIILTLSLVHSLFIVPILLNFVHTGSPFITVTPLEEKDSLKEVTEPLNSEKKKSWKEISV